jgi:hypothetical protein
VRLIVLIAAIGTLPEIAAADIRIAIGNDVFTEVDPPIDDNGFTNDIDIHFWRPYRDYLVGGRLVHRWITEDTDVPSGRRRDLVDLVATAERPWRFLTGAVRVGPTFTGNLGGRYMQNGWHYLCRCGTLLEDGLQSEYEDNDIGALAGARVRAVFGTWLQAYAFTDGQVSIGTGVSSFETAVGGSVEAAHRFGAHAELAVMRFHVVDERLALPGAYRPGWHGAWRLGVHYARGRVRVDYEYRANESGSGEPFAVIAVTIKQAGTAF